MSRTRGDADVIVIGAGAGGLTAAAYLAALGREVVVVDRQPQAGGNTAVFTRGDYEFDIGLHYLGSSGHVRPAVRAFLEPLGVDLAFREQDPDGFDELLFEDMTFAVPAGVEAFRARLHDAFPRERAKVDRHLGHLVAVGRALQQAAPKSGREALGYAWRTREVIVTARTTLGGELDRLGCSPRLKTVLSWLHGVYAVAPSRVAFGMHAAVCLHYLDGAWYPQGGARAVSDALVEAVGRHGGRLRLDTAVTRILVEDGRVAGVRLAPVHDGAAAAEEELRAPVVVAAGDLKRTFLDLLAPDAVSGRLRRRVARYEMAGGLFIVYLVLDRDLAAEGRPNRNWHVIDCDDLDSLYASFSSGQLPAQQWTWITSASLKDPASTALCRPGQTNLQIMSGAPSGHEFWDVGPGLERGPRYAERKRQLRDRLVRHAERAIPGLADAIAYEETATPVTLERHLGSTGGTSYGIAATPGQFGMLRPAARTPIDGLFLAGASARSGHGITGAIRGGVEVAREIAGAEAVAGLHEGPPARVAVTA